MIYGIKPQVDVARLSELGVRMDRNEPVPASLVAECRRKGEALLGTQDAAWGWTVVVACAAASWDAPEAQRLARKAIQSVGPQPALLCNLAVSFKHLARPDLACEYSRWAYELAPRDADAVLCHCDDLFTLGRFAEGSQVAQKSRHLPCHDDAIDNFARLFVDVLRDIDRAGLRQDPLQAEMALALQVLAQSNIRYEGAQVRCDADPEDGTCSLAVSFEFFGTLNDEMLLGSILAPRLAELPRWDPCVLNTGFVYLSREDAHATA